MKHHKNTDDDEASIYIEEKTVNVNVRKTPKL